MAVYDVSKSMVEIAEEYIRINGKQNIHELMASVAEIKKISTEDYDKLAQLYIDMTLSANFVYCGNDEWDLKENNLELWDKDGSYFNKDEIDEDDDDDDLTIEDYLIPEEDEVELSDDDDDKDEEDIDEDEDDDVIIIDDDTKIYSTDDDDEDIDLDFDADDYHEVMDDYEDLYDDK